MTQGYLFVADSMGLSSFISAERAPKKLVKNK